jgi:hypothetical protein
MYSGDRFQRGSGFGAMFGSLLRSILPIAKTVGKVVGKQALRAGAAVAFDVLRGANVKRAIKKRGKAGLKRVAKKAVRKYKQKGRGIGIQPKGRGSSKTIKGPAKRKNIRKKERDTFGLF